MSKAGSGFLTATIETPCGHQRPLVPSTPRADIFNVCTYETGAHKITVKMGEHHIRGSPFELHSVESVGPLAKGPGLHNGIEGLDCLFCIHMPPTFSAATGHHLEVEITGPSGACDFQWRQLNSTVYEFVYRPSECGLFAIDIRFNEQAIACSPFTCRVVNPHKVKIANECDNLFYDPSTEILDLELNRENTFSFDVSKAGPGRVTTSIVAPMNRKLPFREQDADEAINRKQKIHFTPVFEGMFFFLHLFTFLLIYKKYYFHFQIKLQANMR